MFAVRCPALLLQILRFAQNDNEGVLGMTFLVILNAATGGVKDLEHRTVILHQILRFAQNDNEGCSE